MNKKIKDKSKIQIYGITDKKDKTKFLTIANTTKQCREFVSNLFKIEKHEHYQNWCDLKKVDSKNPENWNTYYNTCVSPEEKNEYIIVPMIYQWKDVLAIMRMFAGCIPVGSSFDTNMEILYFKTLMKTKEMYENYLSEEESKNENGKNNKGYEGYDA